MVVMGSLLVIIALAITLNYFLVLEQIPDAMVEWLKEQDLSRTGFLVLVNIMLLIVGCFMDIMSAILILAPMLAPMAAAVGVNPVHMGIIFIVNLEIGYLTPPVGLNLFVSSTLFKKSLGWVIRAVLPTLAIMMVALVIVTWVPSLSLGLVEALRAKPAAVEEPAAPKVKSLDESMGDTSGGSGNAATPKVKSLQEIMNEAKTRSSGEQAAVPDDAGTPGTPGRVKSLQEIMQEAKANNNDAAAVP